GFCRRPEPIRLILLGTHDSCQVDHSEPAAPQFSLDEVSSADQTPGFPLVFDSAQGCCRLQCAERVSGEVIELRSGKRVKGGVERFSWVSFLETRLGLRGVYSWQLAAPGTSTVNDRRRYYL